MNPKKYRKLEGMVGKDSYLAALARRDLVEQGFTEFTEDEPTKLVRRHSEQMGTMLGYMRKRDRKAIVK